MEYKVTFLTEWGDRRDSLIEAISPEAAHKEAYFDERSNDEDIVEICERDGKVVYDGNGFH